MGASALGSYVEINRHTSRLNAITASLIWFAMIAAVWGNWRQVAIVATGQVLAVTFNVWTNHRGIDLLGPRVELARAVVNMLTTVGVGYLTHWPLPIWLWPPFTALAFDRSGGNYTLWVVTLPLVAQDVVSLADGVGWLHPMVSTLMTIYAWRISVARVQIIRDMLERSNQQRAEVELAHQTTHAALAQLKREVAAREQIEIELRSAQKLEALGRIASGVAHEINTPIQFVGNSVTFLQEGIADVLSLCQLNTSVRTASTDDTRAEAIAAADAAEEEADLPYLIENLPQALSRARDGVDRVALIVRSMKQFAHSDASGATETDLGNAIEATLAISRHEYKLVADVELALDALPAVTCNAGEINQVLLNIVVNAAHAIAGGVGSSGRRGTIRITGRRELGEVVIAIGDTGTGIPPAIRHRIFEPFFTTKGVGQGSGQGLAIAKAIVERHGGRLTFETELGRGTTFQLRLPIGGHEPPPSRESAPPALHA